MLVYMSRLTCTCFLFFRIPRPPVSTLFPYTTLFRSRCVIEQGPGTVAGRVDQRLFPHPDQVGRSVKLVDLDPPDLVRSEEHTSELQSHSDLVCRLLLEKKKKKKSQRCTEVRHLV